MQQLACSWAVHAADVLVYGPSVGEPGGSKGLPDSNEIMVAEDAGHDVTVVDGAGWAGMSTQDFASFDAIVFGDGACSGDEGVFDTPNANKTTWSPAVTGTIVMHTFDPFAHETDADDVVGAIGLVTNGINTAAAGRGTGLYYANGCRDSFPPPPAKGDTEFILPFMSEFGEFILRTPNGDPMEIVDPDSPVVAGLTSDDLSDWGQSVHAYFQDFPGDFGVVVMGDPPLMTKGNEGLRLPTVIVLERLSVTIPTLSPWSIGVLVLGLIGVGIAVLRRSRCTV